MSHAAANGVGQSDLQDRLIMSPRANLHCMLGNEFGSSVIEPALLEQSMQVLQMADAENKLQKRKLYLVLDLDETLVYTQRMEPGATARGTQIHVQGKPFDVIFRPGLKHFLATSAKDFIIYMYTMGDEEYAKAVLDLIDPEGKLFTGGVCCWREPESRKHKSLNRVVVNKAMALVVDDTPDVWVDDLANLCLVRRFVGDLHDDGLMQLSGNLTDIHSRFYPAGTSYSFDDTHCNPPDVRDVLHQLRGSELLGCKMALTGILTDQTQETLQNNALAVLIKIFGGALTMDVEEATHLVARQKPGWEKSGKIKRAMERQQEGGFDLVWDHWLLDSLCSWQRQPEDKYLVAVDEAAGPPATTVSDKLLNSIQSVLPPPKAPSPASSVSSMLGLLSRQDVPREVDADTILVSQPRKRVRDAEPGVMPSLLGEGARVARGGMSLSQYLGNKRPLNQPTTTGTEA